MDHGRILALNTPAELKKLIPGAALLELNVSLPTRVLSGSSLPAVTPASADLLDALRSFNGVSRVEEVPTTQAGSGVTTVLYRIYAEDAQSLVSTATRVLVNGGADLQDLRLVKPSLEDVFIYLTGRNLRA